MKKRLVVVGGANGVGKTTFAYQYRDEYKIDYLGADEITAQITTQKGENIELKAGKIFFLKLNEYVSQNKSLIIESTLSGVGLSKNFNEFKLKGYSIHIVYVFLDDVELCKNRISARVKKGGHTVPEKDIERRFHRSLLNFRKIYLPIADTWQIFYNGLKRPTEIAVGEADEIMILDDEYYKIFLEMSE